MSKFNSNFVKSKIESIAKNPKSNSKLKENNLSISSQTLKDSFSHLEEFKDSIKKDFTVKKVFKWY